MLKKKKEKIENDLENRVFPIRPSPEDDRDYVYDENKILTRDINDVLDLRPMMRKPRDQGKRGTCAGFAAAAIKEYQELVNVEFKDYMSPNSVYFFRENQDSEGMYCRDVMKILHKRGISPEKFFPYSDDYEPTTVPEKASMMMSNFKIRQYARVTSISGAKEALYKYGPLLMAVPVYNNSPTIWKPKKSGDLQRGGHAMVVVGYNMDGFIVRNSWGSSWNGDGYVIYPYSDWGAHWELWSCIDDFSDPVEISSDEECSKQKKWKFCFC